MGRRVKALLLEWKQRATAQARPLTARPSCLQRNEQPYWCNVSLVDAGVGGSRFRRRVGLIWLLCCFVRTIIFSPCCLCVDWTTHGSAMPCHAIRGTLLQGGSCVT